MNENEVIIEEIDTLLSDDVVQCDFSFEIISEMVAPFEDPMLHVRQVDPYWKKYEFNPIVSDRSGNEKLIAIARTGGHLQGYIIVTKSWNNYGLIDDFAVDRQKRGAGIGRLLMDKAVNWSKSNKFHGLRLETQSNNLLACRFYYRYGFRLGGFDKFLYTGLRPSVNETALFWYLIF